MLELLLSAGTGALVAALVTLYNGERKIKIENVTKERAKWRKEIREISLSVHRGFLAKDKEKLRELRLILGLNLNPYKYESEGVLNEDRQILILLDSLIKDGSEEKLAEFGDRIALLLKHDWDRAKFEAESYFQKTRCLSGACIPKRITYDEFVKQLRSLQEGSS